MKNVIRRDGIDKLYFKLSQNKLYNLCNYLEYTVFEDIYDMIPLTDRYTVRSYLIYLYNRKNQSKEDMETFILFRNRILEECNANPIFFFRELLNMPGFYYKDEFFSEYQDDLFSGNDDYGLPYNITEGLLYAIYAYTHATKILYESPRCTGRTTLLLSLILYQDCIRKNEKSYVWVNSYNSCLNSIISTYKKILNANKEIYMALKYDESINDYSNPHIDVVVNRGNGRITDESNNFILYEFTMYVYSFKCFSQTKPHKTILSNIKSFNCDNLFISDLGLLDEYTLTYILSNYYMKDNKKNMRVISETVYKHTSQSLNVNLNQYIMNSCMIQLNIGHIKTFNEYLSAILNIFNNKAVKITIPENNQSKDELPDIETVTKILQCMISNAYNQNSKIDIKLWD